ncbi:CHAP domain-containing protein [Microbacterium paludicola]|uniref:CHAP domain-containing protein n=1 Tax=Microbacterium paludicola TaxID=300019 RepID=A0A4Y9G0R7_9MICO|nr:CHAP domain-containing protein [Microbacterium paludicola]MBF0815065.1 CHAP domain-containing protein [Microbacterium paludicola]TFU34341.1 CHAP domain-containing protein [Microbacterium paludicola]
MTIVDRRAGIRLPRALAALLATLALVVSSLVFVAPAQAITWGPKLCDGFAACAAKGYGNAGYQSVYKQSFWNMYGGHNCTNYVAYRMQKAGIPRFVRVGYGNAYQWGAEAKAAGLAVDKGTPRVGDVAWWDRAAIGGSGLGHVAYVEKVDVRAGTFTVSEDNYSSDFDWRVYRISEVSGFIRVAKPSLPASPIPTVSGSAVVGGTLTARPGTWAPTGVALTYRWLRNGAAISGATKSTYRVVTADAGTKVSVQVTGAKAGYTTTTRRSAAVSVPLLAMSAPVPTITGTLRVGSTLTANPGAWAPSGVVLTYQWLRAGQPIAGATARTYRLAAADKGKAISVRVTGKKANYATTARTSKATAAIR